MTPSDYFRRRTGASGLDDNAFLIFDRFYDGYWRSPDLLYESAFSHHFNLPFSHGLSDAVVNASLARWVEAGWMEYEEEDRLGYALTPAGGAVWERERLPVWERYCRDSYRFPKTRRQPIIEIVSPSCRTALAFFRTGKRCGLFGGKVVGRSVSIRVRPGDKLASSWKTFPRTWAIQAALRPDTTYRRTDWTLYEKERLWWRNPSELARR